TCVLAGEDITNDSAHRRSRAGISRTFQTPRLLNELTVYENVFTAASAPGCDPGSAHQRTMAAIRLAGVEHLAEELAGNISPGALRFIEIARAMSRAPRVILMDEPAGGLTGDAQRHLMDILIAIRDLGC